MPPDRWLQSSTTLENEEATAQKPEAEDVRNRQAQYRKCAADTLIRRIVSLPTMYHNQASRFAAPEKPVKVENRLKILSGSINKGYPKRSKKVNFVSLSASIYGMATAFFSFGRAKFILILGYIHSCPFCEKFILTLFMSSVAIY